MKTAKAAPALLFFLLGTGVLLASDDYQLVERGHLDVGGLSELAKLVVQNSEGVFGSNAYLLAHATAAPELARIINEAEYARRELAKLFDSAEAIVAPVIFIASIGSPAMWDEIIRTHGLRQDGLAMRLGREIYFESEELPENRPDRIMHEMVHVRMGQDFQNLPHWLDEGVAAYLGWIFAARYQAGKNLKLVRQHPATNEHDLYPLDELLALTDYPRSPARIRAFYRQSELMVKYLVEQGGMSKLKDIMAALDGNREDPLAAFRAASGMDPVEEAGMMQAIKDELIAGSVPVP